MRFELKLMLGVYMHRLIHHLRQFVSIIHLSIAVFIVALRDVFVFVIIRNITLILLLLNDELLIITSPKRATVLKLLTIYCRLGQQLWVLDVLLVTAAHAAKVIHCTVHIRQFLYLLLGVSLLELLLIVIIALVIARCLKLSLY